MLQEIKEYMRIDEDYEDLLIQTLITSAETYLSNAGVIVDYENSLYKLAVKMLVLHWYENREVIGDAKKLSYSLDSIITQLVYSYEVL